VTGVVPGRVFLDTSILQTLQDYGPYIYDGDSIPFGDHIFGRADGPANLEALRDIVRVWSGHGQFQLAISRNSLQEVADRGHSGYLQWALEVADYCENWLTTVTDTHTPEAQRLATMLGSGAFGYLGVKDRQLIQDAVLLGCDAFLTFERRLPTNSGHLKQRLRIEVVQPTSYWNLLAPWAGLF